MPSQPTDTTCGPTCLYALYKYYDYNIELETLIKEIQFLKAGGTLSVLLGIDALKRGFSVTLYSYNLKIFDPTWEHLPPQELINKLEQQMAFKNRPKLTEATEAYIKFLQMGGKISLNDLSPAIIQKYLNSQIPLLVGLSATYLYRCEREYAPNAEDCIPDDVRGWPVGHFVVLCDIIEGDQVSIADPYPDHPQSLFASYYPVNMQRVINAILLGIVTYDANLLVVEPK